MLKFPHFTKLCHLKRVNTYSKSSRKVQKDNSKLSEVRQYFKSKDSLKSIEPFIPNRFFRVKLSPTDYNFVVDDEVAARIVKILRKNLVGPTPVIEANPGLGLLTKHLLKVGVEKLFVYDSMINQMTPLREIMTENPNKVACIPVDVFQVGRIVARDKFDNGDRFETMFKEIPRKAWKEAPAIKLFGVLLTANYIAYLLRSIAFRDVFSKIGRIEHFLIVSDDVYKRQIVEQPKGRLRTSMLFNCFFKTEKLGEFPRTAFLPWDKKLEHDSKKEVAHFVRTIPKANLYDEFTNSELKVFWYFVNGICRSKHQRVIAYFENWAPSSGLHLVKLGLSPMTEIGDLTSSETVQLFRLFTSLPQFDEEHFTHMQEAELLTTNETARTVIVKEE